MSNYEVETIYPCDLNIVEMSQRINKVITEREKSHWTFVPPVTTANMTNDPCGPGLIIMLTFRKDD